jgi:RHS repeat-associated protein
VHEAVFYYENDNGGNSNMAQPVDGGPGGGGVVIDGGGQPTISYDANGNLIHYKEWNYRYDAQNRLTEAWNGTTTAQFYYDGKSRQIARNINGVIRFNSWDGWELLEEWSELGSRDMDRIGRVVMRPSERERTSQYSSSLNVATGYLQGTTGVIKSWSAANTLYYYQDKLGSTTQVANASGQLVESYHYDLTGTPSYFNSTSQPINSSTVGAADLYAGERWIPELRLYDLRNRFMSPELGRFLQPDPVGFQGDGSNLYRYCGNDPVDRSDPTGLIDRSSSADPWTRLTDFFNGNPSMDVVRDAWNTNLIRSAKEPAASQSSAPAGSPAQNQPGVPDYAVREIDRAYPHKDGATYWARIFWRITLYHHNQKHLGSGIKVREKIEFKDPVGFTAKKDLGQWETRGDGSVEDHYFLPFNRPDGQVKVIQTVLAGGREARWEATVHATPDKDGNIIEASQYAPFR